MIHIHKNSQRKDYTDLHHFIHTGENKESEEIDREYKEKGKRDEGK